MTAVRGVTMWVVAALLMPGCGGGSSPTSPSAVLSVAGTWTGPGSDSSGPGRMTWRLAQAGTSFSGAVTFTETSTGLQGRGTVSGSVAGSAITFSIVLPPGGFDSPYDTCAATFDGQGGVTTQLLYGNYTGSNSCTGKVTAGVLTLDKS